jgi:outer membrane protein TolC
MQIEAAKAGIDIAKASGRPTLSLSSSTGYSDTSIGAASRSSSALVQLSIPIFTGFSSTYKIEAAKVEAKLRELDYQKLEKQIALDVYKAYNNLGTQAVAVESSTDLLASAEESYKNASGRYKAGVGTILDLLTAQNSLASAKQQRVEAAYNWLIAKATLAYALGKLTTENLENGK